MQNYHVSKGDNGWEMREEGGDTPVLTEPTKEQIVAGLSTFMAGKTGSVKIHKMDGTFEEERTYPRSADPSASPG